MSTSASQDFKAPDVRVMADAQTLVYNLIKSLPLDFLPVMKDKLPFVKTAVSQASYTFRKELNKVLSGARHLDLSQTDRLRVQIEADASLNAEQRQEALRQVQAQRTHVLLKLTHTVRQAENAVLKNIDELTQINLKPTSERLQQTLQDRLDTHEENIAARAKQMAVLKEDKKVLDDAIMAYEKSNLADTFKNVLPTPDELSALTSTPVSQIAVINAGIARLERLRGDISKGLTYLDLTAERDNLRARYEQLFKESMDYDQQARETSHGLEQLGLLAELDQAKATWANEARKAVDSLRAFSNAYLPDARASSLTQQHLQALVSYLSGFVTIEREL